MSTADSGALSVGNLFFGDSNSESGHMTQYGGTVTVSNILIVGHWPNNTSTYTMTNGVLNLTGTPSGGSEQSGIIYLGVDGTGEFIQSNGTVTAKGLVLDNRGDTAGTDLYELSGGTLTLTGAANGRVDKVIPGGGDPVKEGIGTWTLNGNNSYSGGTTVNGGTLVVAAGSGTGGGTLSDPAVGFRWTGSNTGATHLSGWNVSGGLRAVIVGNEVRFQPAPGTVFCIR